MTQTVEPGIWSRARDYLRELWRRRDFAWFLAMGRLRAQNASTTLGLAWWVLNPLLLGGVYFLVFTLLFTGRRPDDFLVYLMAGMFVFRFSTTALTGGARSILSNSKLLVNQRFPRLILPIADLIESTVGFLASLGLLMLLALFVEGIWPSVNLLLLLLVFPLQLLFNLGLATGTARLAVPFRDIGNFIPYISRLWFYLTPVIWPLDMIAEQPELVQTLVRVNPLYGIVAAYRTAFLGYPFDGGALAISAVWVAVVLAAGVYSFIKIEGRMVRYL